MSVPISSPSSLRKRLVKETRTLTWLLGMAIGVALGAIACAPDRAGGCNARIASAYLDLMEIGEFGSLEPGAVNGTRAELRDALRDCPVPSGGLDVPTMGRWTSAELAVAADDIQWVSENLDSVHRQVPLASAGTDYAPLLNVAAGYATRPMVELLIANGFDANMADLAGETPLMVSAYVGLQSGVDNSEALLRAGADVNAIADNGATALYYAVLRDNALLVELFLAHGARVRPRGPTDDSIVSLARKREHAGVLKLIESADALTAG